MAMLSLTFTSTEGLLCVTIPIIDDSISEEQENFTVNLVVDTDMTTLNGTVSISLASTLVIIQDDDCECVCLLGITRQF